MNRPAGIGLVRVVVSLGAGLLAVLLFAAPPQARPPITQAAPPDEETIEVHTASGLGYGSAISPTHTLPEMTAALEGGALEESDASRVHWTSKGTLVRIGPGASYVVIGQLPRSARLQIVGRDESSKWIAIVFSPYTGLTAWIEASAVAGQLDVSGLEIASVTLLNR